MKKVIIHIVFFLTSITGYGQQTVSIPDAAFLAFLKNNFPQTINASDQLVTSIAAQVTGNISCGNSGITNLEGIQYFSKVTKISAINNNIVSIPSLLPMTNLETVHIYNNKLATMPDFAGMQKLKTVLLYENELTQMPLFGNNPIIEEIIISKNKLTSVSPLSVVPSLLKLDVGENALTQLPDLSLNVNLEELICWSNKLTALPSLKNLTKLKRLNAGTNKLTQTPDLSANTALTIVALDNNFLKDIPNILDYNLTTVKLYNNYFTFEDLYPYTTRANFSTAFDCTPMLRIPIADTIDAYYSQSVDIHTNIDKTLSNVTYEWFEGSASVAVGDAAVITSANGTGVSKRYLYAKIKHPSIPNLTLTTDSILVRFNPCPVSADITYTASKKDCGNAGAVNIDVHGYVPPETTYILTSTSFGSNEYYQSGNITGLIDTAYQLQIEFIPGCVVDYLPLIEMPYVDCKEVFMTPNGDGDMDTYFIPGSGNAIIYDKNGSEVKKVKLSYEWNGYGPNGLVQAGYYIIVVNGGKDRIYISVLY